MAKGLIGSVNTTHSGVGVSATSNGGLVATAGDTPTYSGKVNNVSSPTEYTGVETDSMSINVDNNSRTISGEVKWINMIASTESEEDAFHAYPANKARIKFSDIDSSISELRSSVSSCGKSCNESLSKVQGYVEEIESIQAALDECESCCENLRMLLCEEKKARKQAELTLKTADSTNMLSLQGQIDTARSTILTELNSRLNTISQDNSEIKAETERAKSEEESIKARVTSVTNQSNANKSAIESVKSAYAKVAARISTLESSDASAVASRNEAAIQELQKSISSTSSKLNSDYELVLDETSVIKDIQYKHESRITELTADVTESKVALQGVTNKSNATEKKLTSLIKDHSLLSEKNNKEHSALLSKVLDEAYTRSETDAYHEQEIQRLEVRISNLQEDIARVIEALADEVRLRDAALQSEIDNIGFDFIDAGNAPV